jgi:ATP-dependent Clp protease ATP-binding subunit ClpA
MKTTASMVLDPNRRSADARDFEGGLHRKIVGQDAAVEKVVEIYQMFLAGLNPPGSSRGIAIRRCPRLHQDRLC